MTDMPSTEAITALCVPVAPQWDTVLAQGGFSNSHVALILVVVGVSLMIAITARRQRARDAASPRAYAREQVARLREEAQSKDEVDALLVEVQDTTRQFNAQLDTKFCKLERLIRDADDRIQRLEHLVRMTARLPDCDVTVGDRTETLTSDHAPASSASVDDRHAEIHQLADAGYSAVEIADQTGRTPAEIDLILALRRESFGTSSLTG